ncbi:molybdenum cofactor synthesis 2 [Gloeopeniophorella convolvens]|nr:molybdenum cofactor synthesis 2 [Gloeopeniophorella convolvens]
MSSSTHSSSVEGRLRGDDGLVVLTYQPLDPAQIILSVQDDAAGAIAVFVGTTRNSFQGKFVTHLQYESYTKLALKTMADILRAARTTSDAVLHSVIYHRLGDVPVGQPSIVVAVSSPHRREAFVACEMILEEVKKKAQIWKREYYEGEGDELAQWKTNVH